MGDNSNGKSVIVRTTRDLLCNNIKKPQVRYDLVNKDASYGEMIYTRDDGVMLTLHLTREAALTWVSLQEPDGEPIIRYLADKNYMELVRRFGWDVDEESNLPLNIAESDDALFFYKTPNKVNARKLQAASTDMRADATLVSLETTLKEGRKFKDTSVANVRVIQSALDKLEIGDIPTMKKGKDVLMYYYRNLSKIYIPELPAVKAVPHVKILSLYHPILPKIHYPKLYDVSCKIPDMSGVLRDLKAVRERKCPTCGRGFDCDC
ncbi:MAG: hypothetical protein NC548_30725 [Lachnospiraceae bacterium]|nr:hypothetical protein [Lachnospiraceae bacterium]